MKDGLNTTELMRMKIYVFQSLQEKDLPQYGKPTYVISQWTSDNLRKHCLGAVSKRLEISKTDPLQHFPQSKRFRPIN